MRRVALLFVVLLSAACTRDPSSDPAAAEGRAQALLGPYKNALKNELTTALGQGPAAAIDACASRAPALAAEHSRDGVRVGRSAKKLRTPADAPPEWLVPVMDELEKTRPIKGKVVPLGQGRWGYAEPIYIQAQCLVCHGETIAPEIDAKLRERYPTDAARGFKIGDFRGVFFVELDRSAFPKP